MAPKLSWTFEPAVIVGVLALGALYLAAWRQARRPGQPHPPGFGRLLLFATGLLMILAALVSPLDSLGDQRMVMHMAQHMLLLDIAPILLILGLTKGILRPVVRRLHEVERRAGYLAHPAVAVALYAGVMWLWHIPALYDRAQGSSFLHVLEHTCFFAAGALYWWASALARRNRAAWAWFVGWFNFLGEVAVTAAIDFGAATTTMAFLSLTAGVEVNKWACVTGCGAVLHVLG